MDIVVKTLKCELRKVDNKLGKIISIMNADPITRIIELKEEAQKILEECGGDYERVAELILPLAKEEKEMFALSKKQCGTTLINKRVKLEDDKYNLINAIYHAEHK